MGKAKKTKKTSKKKRDADNPETAPGTTLRRRRKGKTDEQKSEVDVAALDVVESDEDNEETDPSALLKRAVEGDNSMTKNQEHAALEEFYRRLTGSKGLSEDQKQKREKIKKMFGLTDDKIRLAVEYAKQGKKIPMSRGQKIERCLDCSIFLFLLLFLGISLYYDYGTKVFYMAGAYLRRWFPNEADILTKAVERFTTFLYTYII